MKGNFPRCAAVTLGYEGGNDDDINDPGGRTSRGILQSEWTDYRVHHAGLSADVWSAPQADILAIYGQNYWQPIAGDLWPAGLDLAVYDAAVNSGVARIRQWCIAVFHPNGAATFQNLALLAGAVSDRVAAIQMFSRKRLSFLEALRTWQFFGRGWFRRVAGIEATAVKWALQAAGQAPAGQLQKESDAANRKAKTAATTAGGAAGGGTIAGTQVDMSHAALEHWLMAGALVVGLVALVAFLIWQWNVHSARSAAYAEAAQH